MNDKVQAIKHNELLKNTLTKTLTTLGSIISIGFGIWHFFIPGNWNWYSYIDKTANELLQPEGDIVSATPCMGINPS